MDKRWISELDKFLFIDNFAHATKINDLNEYLLARKDPLPHR